MATNIARPLELDLFCRKPDADHTSWLVQSKYIEAGTVKAGLMDAIAQQNQG